MFACPVCGLPLMPMAGFSDSGAWLGTRLSGTLVCAAGHTFDVARQGYVSLVRGDSHIAGDTATMVQARASFLASGVYEPIAQALVEIVGTLEGKRDTTDNLSDCASLGALPSCTQVAAGCRRATFVDLGGGTGYYSATLLDALTDWDGILLDVSKYAAKIAARAHPRLRVATADLRTTIPLLDACVDAALVVFAPRNTPEIRRILVPGGVCVVVTPTQRHLQELRATLPMLTLDPDKEERLTRQFADFDLVGQEQIEFQVSLSPDQVRQVVGMGPSAFHTEIADLGDQIPESANTTISVDVRGFRPKMA